MRGNKGNYPIRRRVNKLLRMAERAGLVIVSAPAHSGKLNAVQGYLSMGSRRPAVLRSEALTAQVDEMNLDGGQYGAIIVRDAAVSTDVRQFARLLETCEAQHPGIPVFYLVDVPPPLAWEWELTARGAAVLTLKDLAYTAQEIGQLSGRLGLELPEDAWERIRMCTGGWQAGVRLVLERYAQFGEIDELLGGMLMAQVLRETLGEDDAQLLSKLALLDVFTLEMAETVLQIRGVTTLLERLSNADIFEKQVEDGSYRIQSYIGCALRSACPLPGEAIRRIYGRLGVWFRMQGRPIDAILAFEKAEDQEAIFILLSQKGASEYFDLIPQYLLTLCQSHEEYLMQEYPIVYLTYIQALMMNEPNHIVVKKLMDAKKFYAVSPERYRTYLGEIQLMESFLHVGPSMEMMEYYKNACKLFGKGSSAIYSRDMIFTFGAPHLLSIYHQTPGGLQGEIETLGEGFGYFMQATDGCGAGGYDLVCAEHALETGLWTRSKELAVRAAYQAEQYGQASVWLAARFLQLRLAAAQGEGPTYKRLWNEVNEVGGSWESPLLRRELDLAGAYLWRPGYKMEEPAEWICGPRREMDVLHQCTGWREIVTGMVLLRRGQYVQLEVLAEGMCTTSAWEKQIFVRLYGYLYRAAALAGLGKDGQGALRQAMFLAQPDRIVLPFAEVGEVSCGLLLEEDGSFARQVLAVEKQVRRGWETIQSAEYKGELTRRELEVLQYLDAGYRQSEVAVHMGISVNTVKRHVAGAYRKLGVTTRAEALQSYRDGGRN